MTSDLPLEFGRVGSGKPTGCKSKASRIDIKELALPHKATLFYQIRKFHCPIRAESNSI